MAGKNNTVTAEFPWWGWLIISCIVGFIGGVFLSVASSYAGALGTHYYTYIDKWASYFYPGVFFISASIVLDVFMLKALITEAHVKAMEVFYGKKREVKSLVADKTKSPVKKEKKKVSETSWVDYDD